MSAPAPGWPQHPAGIVDIARRRQAGHILRGHDAPLGLAGFDPVLAQVVEMRFFAGLNDREIARALEISERAVRRPRDQVRLLLAWAPRRLAGLDLTARQAAAALKRGAVAVATQGGRVVP